MSLNVVLLDEDQLIAEKEDIDELMQQFTHCERFASSAGEECATRILFRRRGDHQWYSANA